MPIYQVPKQIVVTIPQNANDKVRLISFKVDDNTILRNAIVEVYFKGVPGLADYSNLAKNKIRLELHGSSTPTASTKIAESSIVNIKTICEANNSFVAQIRFDFNSLAWPGLHLQGLCEYHLFGCVTDYVRDASNVYIGFVHDWSDIHGYRGSIDFGQFIKFNDSKMPIKTALFGIKSGVTYTL